MDVAPVKKLVKPVSLEDVKANPKLKEMILLKISRLSVQPVKEDELEIILKMYEKGIAYVRAFDVATVYLGLQDRNQALAWLEKGCSDHDIWALNLKADPVYADLRTEPRFVALLRTVGLDQ